MLSQTIKRLNFFQEDENNKNQKFNESHQHGFCFCKLVGLSAKSKFFFVFEVASSQYLPLILAIRSMISLIKTGN